MPQPSWLSLTKRQPCSFLTPAGTSELSCVGKPTLKRHWQTPAIMTTATATTTNTATSSAESNFRAPTASNSYATIINSTAVTASSYRRRGGISAACRVSAVAVSAAVSNLALTQPKPPPERCHNPYPSPPTPPLRTQLPPAAGATPCCHCFRKTAATSPLHQRRHNCRHAAFPLLGFFRAALKNR